MPPVTCSNRPDHWLFLVQLGSCIRREVSYLRLGSTTPPPPRGLTAGLTVVTALRMALPVGPLKPLNRQRRQRKWRAEPAASGRQCVDASCSATRQIINTYFRSQQPQVGRGGDSSCSATIRIINTYLRFQVPPIGRGITASLVGILREWLTVHPGGKFLFCQSEVLARSKKRSERTGFLGEGKRPSGLQARMATVTVRKRSGTILPLTKDEIHITSAGSLMTRSGASCAGSTSFGTRSFRRAPARASTSESSTISWGIFQTSNVAVTATFCRA